MIFYKYDHGRYRVAHLHPNDKLLVTTTTLFSPMGGQAVDNPVEEALSRVEHPEAYRTVARRGAHMCTFDMDPLVANRLQKQKTAVGRKLAKLWMQHPVDHAPTLAHRLDRVTFYVQRPDERDRLQKVLAGLPACRIPKRPYGKILGLLEGARGCQLGIPVGYYNHLKKTVDESGAFLAGEDVELHRLYGEMTTLRGRAERIVSQHQGTLVEEGGNFFCRQSKRSCTVRTVKRSRKNDVTFELPELTVLSQQFDLLRQEYAQRCDTKREVLSALTTPFVPTLEGLQEEMAEIDVFTSWAVVATGWVRPTVSGRISLIQVRHPTTTVPNDIKMEVGEHRVLTGYIASGKSTVMRTVAAAVYLHQIGMYVPARRAELPLFSGVYGVFHARDRRGSSTFAEHLGSIKRIVDHGDARSLVFLDELCNGTNVDEGFQVAQRILDRLKGRTVLVTTHLRGLGTDRWHLSQGYCLKKGESKERRAIEYGRRLGLYI